MSTANPLPPPPHLPKTQSKLGKDADNNDKQKALVDVLLPLQMEVAESAGLAGDAGYVKMQVMLMYHSTDDTVAYNTMSSTLALYRRAGIDLSRLE